MIQYFAIAFVLLGAATICAVTVHTRVAATTHPMNGETQAAHVEAAILHARA